MSEFPPTPSDKSRARVGTIDVLRGLAAVAVAWFHFTNGNPAFLDPGLLKRSGHLGWLGVEVFFVVSGFIIPYSLYRGGYRVRLHWLRFVTKRILRLDPPYLATIVLVIVLTYVSAAVPGIIAFQYYADIIDLKWFAVLFPAMAAVSYGAIGYLPTIVGVGAGLMVAFVKLRPTRLFVFLSSISYSLYLLHTLIGGRVINMGMRLPETLVIRIVILTMAMGSSILASYLFYRFIELPSQRWSSALGYTPARLYARPTAHDDVAIISSQSSATETP